jgi:hypothetical protein
MPAMKVLLTFPKIFLITSLDLDKLVTYTKSEPGWVKGWAFFVFLLPDNELIINIIWLQFNKLIIAFLKFCTTIFLPPRFCLELRLLGNTEDSGSKTGQTEPCTKH